MLWKLSLKDGGQVAKNEKPPGVCLLPNYLLSVMNRRRSQRKWEFPKRNVQADTNQGLWVRLEDAGRRYVVMVRWDYILPWL